MEPRTTSRTSFLFAHVLIYSSSFSETMKRLKSDDDEEHRDKSGKNQTKGFAWKKLLNVSMCLCASVE